MKKENSILVEELKKFIDKNGIAGNFFTEKTLKIFLQSQISYSKSQSDLAKELGVLDSTLSIYLSGNRTKLPANAMVALGIKEIYTFK